MKPNYVATKTAWGAVTFWRVVFFWLVIPLIVMIVDIFARKAERIEFYDKYLVVKRGLLSKREKRSVFSGVIGVSVNQSLFGRIFGYGDIMVDVVGKWDVNLKGVSNPNGLKAYLETRTIDPKDTRAMMVDAMY